MTNIVKLLYKLPYRATQKILAHYGLRLVVSEIKPSPPPREISVKAADDPCPSVLRSGLNLNVGAGSYVIDGFRSLDFYSEHYYPSKDAFLKERIAYDLRSDNLPFADGVVDNIYISHVIEHVETEYVEKFISEAFRVLAPGGVLRIVCPDAEFLYAVSGFENEYYRWHPEYGKARQFDMLVHQLATPRLKAPNYGLNSDAQSLCYEDFVSQIKEGLTFDQTTPGNHINNWDYARLKDIGLAVGFARVLNSKPGGCITAAMQGEDIDRPHRYMSLYVDMLKM
jgi:SAM-dependent methyltransferase